MKNIFKKLSVVMALIVCGGIFMPAMAKLQVSAAPITYGYTAVVDYIQVPNFKSTATLKQEYTVAQATDTASGTVTYKVYDPFGTEVSVTDHKFVPNYTGTYKVSYSLNGTTTDFKVQVTAENQGYSIEFPVNNQNIVPTTINPIKKDRITFPNAIVKDADGNVVENADANIVITMTNNGGVPVSNFNSETKVLTLSKTANKTTYIVKYEYKIGSTVVAYNSFEVYADLNYNSTDYKIEFSTTKPTTAEIGVEKVLPYVLATDEKGNKVNVWYQVEVTHKGTTYKTTDTGNDVLTVNADNQVVFTPNASGDYHVKYIINDIYGNQPKNSTTEFDIEDVGDFTAANPIITLPYTAQSTEAEKTLDAKEAFANSWTDQNILVLPIYAVDSANEYIENNLTLKRKVYNNSNTLIFDESVYSTESLANKVLVFNADPNTFFVGGNQATPVDANTVIKTVYVGDKSYNITAGQCEIVSVYGSSQTTYILSDNTYSVRYIAKDKTSGKSEVTVSQTLVISSNFDTATATAPEVKFAKTSTIPSYVNKGETITFDRPTATCTYSDKSTDNNLSTFVTYQTSADKATWSTEIAANATDSWLTFDKATNKYSLSIPETTGSVVYVKVIANSWNTIPNKGTTEKIIEIYFSGSAGATTVAYDAPSSDESLYVQGQAVTLPTVHYTDSKANYLKMNIAIEYYDEEAEEYISYNANDMPVSRNGDVVTIEDAYFTPDQKGTYKITYTSTNINDYKTVLVFNLNIKESYESLTANLLNVPANINSGSAEVGDMITIAPIDVYVSSDYLEAQDWSFVVKGSNTNYESDFKTFIKFNAIGEYTIQFVCNVVYAEDFDATHLEGDLFKALKSKAYTIIAEDTTGPILTNEFAMDNAYFELTKGNSLTKNQRYALPVPEALDIDYANSKVTVKSTKTSETITLNATGVARLGDYSFSQDDTYTITYSLTDFNGQITTKTYNVDVGDVIVPDIEIEDDIVKSTWSVNDILQVDLSKISLTDRDFDDILYKDTDGNYKIIKQENDPNKYYVKLDITLQNTSTGSTIKSTAAYDPSNLKFEFDIEEVGDYKLVVKVTKLTTDTQKSTTHDNILFTVTEDESNPLTSEEVLGIVLIVISVVVLAGVIIYFVVTRKSYKKKFN